MSKTKIITAAEMADHYRPLCELYAAFKHIEKLEADNARLNDALRQAVLDAAEWARKAGEAQGKLEISEAAGILDGWIRDCKRLEADNARLREALEKIVALEDDFESNAAMPRMNGKCFTLPAQHFRRQANADLHLH